MAGDAQNIRSFKPKGGARQASLIEWLGMLDYSLW